ncbi:MAG TPA: hypothetical protein ENI95_00850 [Chloroflexi bacterium]|nr:hypothetical protein [Chloroflexota bacterium]
MRHRLLSRLNDTPRQLWIGLLLIAVAWPLNWLLEGLRTHLLFFPLWLGYALTVDGLVYLRRGTSLLTRNWRAFAGLFLVSAPIWWLFEAINLRTRNWEYVGREYFSDLAYFLLASLSFSTVIPAVFGTAELLSSTGWLRRLPRGPVVRPTRGTAAVFFVAGWAMLALMLIWPRYFFPFIWISLYCIIMPINVWLGHRSLLEYTAGGNWRPVLAMALGALVCGFFWEFWNYFAYPKWVYHVPFVDFLHIFEMPILGYGGYLPFGLELFALYHLVIGLVGPSELRDYLRVGGE